MNEFSNFDRTLEKSVIQNTRESKIHEKSKVNYNRSKKSVKKIYLDILKSKFIKKHANNKKLNSCYESLNSNFFQKNYKSQNMNKRFKSTRPIKNSNLQQQNIIYHELLFASESHKINDQFLNQYNYNQNIQGTNTSSISQLDQANKILMQQEYIQQNKLQFEDCQTNLYNQPEQPINSEQNNNRNNQFRNNSINHWFTNEQFNAQNSFNPNRSGSDVIPPWENPHNSKTNPVTQQNQQEKFFFPSNNSINQYSQENNALLQRNTLEQVGKMLQLSSEQNRNIKMNNINMPDVYINPIKGLLPNVNISYEKNIPYNYNNFDFNKHITHPIKPLLQPNQQHSHGTTLNSDYEKFDSSFLPDCNRINSSGINLSSGNNGNASSNLTNKIENTNLQPNWMNNTQNNTLINSQTIVPNSNIIPQETMDIYSNLAKLQATQNQQQAFQGDHFTDMKRLPLVNLQQRDSTNSKSYDINQNHIHKNFLDFQLNVDKSNEFANHALLHTASKVNQGNQLINYNINTNNSFIPNSVNPRSQERNSTNTTLLYNSINKIEYNENSKNSDLPDSKNSKNSLSLSNQFNNESTFPLLNMNVEPHNNLGLNQYPQSNMPNYSMINKTIGKYLDTTENQIPINFQHNTNFNTNTDNRELQPQFNNFLNNVSDKNYLSLFTQQNIANNCINRKFDNVDCSAINGNINTHLNAQQFGNNSAPQLKIDNMTTTDGQSSNLVSNEYKAQFENNLYSQPNLVDQPTLIQQNRLNQPFSLHENQPVQETQDSFNRQFHNNQNSGSNNGSDYLGTNNDINSQLNNNVNHYNTVVPNENQIIPKQSENYVLPEHSSNIDFNITENTEENISKPAIWYMPPSNVNDLGVDLVASEFEGKPWIDVTLVNPPKEGKTLQYLDLVNVFSPFGTILYITLIPGSPNPNAFICYSSIYSTVLAVHHLNGSPIGHLRDPYNETSKCYLSVRRGCGGFPFLSVHEKRIWRIFPYGALDVQLARGP